jgi:hypothetical protein
LDGAPGEVVTEAVPQVVVTALGDWAAITERGSSAFAACRDLTTDAANLTAWRAAQKPGDPSSGREYSGDCTLGYAEKWTTSSASIPKSSPGSNSSNTGSHQPCWWHSQVSPPRAPGARRRTRYQRWVVLETRPEMTFNRRWPGTLWVSVQDHHHPLQQVQIVLIADVARSLSGFEETAVHRYSETVGVLMRRSKTRPLEPSPRPSPRWAVSQTTTRPSRQRVRL